MEKFEKHAATFDRSADSYEAKAKAACAKKS